MMIILSVELFLKLTLIFFFLKYFTVQFGTKQMMNDCLRTVINCRGIGLEQVLSVQLQWELQVVPLVGDMVGAPEKGS